MLGKTPNFFRKNDGTPDKVKNTKGQICSEYLPILKQTLNDAQDETESGLENIFALQKQIAYVEKKCKAMNEDESGNSFGPGNN